LATSSPEQSRILEALINTASQASAVLSLPIEVTERFIKEVGDFLQKNHDRFGEQPFLLALKHSASTAPKLTLQTLIENINKGKPVLYVNDELRLLDAVVGTATVTECSTLTQKGNLLGVLVNGIYAWEILEGRTIGEGRVNAGGSGPPTISKHHRPMEELESILKDHLEVILNGGQVKYWFNQSKRILSAEPVGTELIFQQSLFTWLMLFVSPKLKIYAEPLGLGQDKTDIIVVTSRGSFVIEIKWLGRNQNDKEYKQDRIDEGLAQVKIYLDNDADLVSGHLVCYDGRSKEVHESESNWNDSLRHRLCRDPKILFLSSDVPSVLAKAIAKGTKP
jgi:hypothetical protein